jgi:SAM-dependent methyltransferase
MNLSLSSLTQKIPCRALLGRVRFEIVGLLQDLWKDTKRPAADKPKKTPAAAGKEPAPAKKKKDKTSSSSSADHAQRAPVQRWHADRFQIMEKIWGEGRTLPCPPDLESTLVAPLGLNSETNVLDLSAGLGGLARDLATNFDTFVTGLEMDAVMARRAMSLSLNAGKSKKAGIEHYDPANFSAARKYDAIVARELFYRIIGKEKFFQAVAAGLKQHGLLVFTDYIFDKKARENKAVALWSKYEPNALPLTLQDMINEWIKLKFDVRVNEDLTDMYCLEIGKRLKIFADFLAKTPPDSDTRDLVLQETELWVRRAEAMQQGLKVYRFETIKM